MTAPKGRGREPESPSCPAWTACCPRQRMRCQGSRVTSASWPTTAWPTPPTR
jgi:hypothetical protein